MYPDLSRSGNHLLRNNKMYCFKAVGLLCHVVFQESPFVPTYAYRCTNCAHEFEIFQKFSEDPLTDCPECGAPIRRIFQPVGIVFKGSGWYVTDSRKGSETSGSDSPDKAKAGDSKAASAPAAEASKPDAPAPAKVAAD